MFDANAPEPAAESATPGSTSDPESSADQPDSESHDGYVPPERGVAPLTGKGPLPRVKRFNRRTVFILIAAITAVAIAAFGTSLTRDPPARKFTESQAETTMAPLAPDVVNHLPGSYADVPQLGRPMPGDLGLIAAGKPMVLNGTPTGLPAPMPVTFSSSVPGRARIVTEEAKLAERAREGGFGFGGGASSSAASSDGADRWAGLGTPPLIPGAPAIPRSDRDADNRQDDKQEFLERNRVARWDLKDRLHVPASAFTLFAGTVVPGVLITGINSDLPGQIEGQISQNVYDTVSGRHLILPQGTKLLGSYDSRVTYGQVRVLVVWTRIIRPDGSNLDLEGMPGTDLSGYAGLTGKVDRHLSRILGAVVLGSLIQAGTAAGTSYTDPTFSDRARQGAGQGINEATQQIVRKELQLQPTILVAPGARFAVFTTRDLSIPPYTG
jgi:type IV secretion system protein TrbI